MVTGVVPSPRYVPSIFIARRVQHSHCRRFSSNAANSCSRAFRSSIFMQRKSPYEYVNSVRIELAKLILVGTRITYQATGVCTISSTRYHTMVRGGKVPTHHRNTRVFAEPAVIWHGFLISPTLLVAHGAGDVPASLWFVPRFLWFYRFHQPFKMQENSTNSYAINSSARFTTAVSY